MKKHINTILLILAIGGAALSAYLWWFQVTPHVIPCTTGQGCSHVLDSEYSYIFGTPMSVFGFFFYTSLILVTFQRHFIKHKILNIILILQVAVGLLFSLYLRYLEFFVIEAICIWCWVSFIIVLLMTAALFIEKPSLKK